jgi:hypothetical protein
MTGADLRLNIGRIMDEVSNVISFGVGRKNAERVDSTVLDKAQDGWSLEATRPLYQKAAAQLGTVGSGNHYVDLFTDEDDRVWIGVHFGSRGFGHGVATWFLNAAGAKDGMDVEPCVLDVNSDLGAQYLRAMSLAGAYAYAGRDWVCDRWRRFSAQRLWRRFTITTTLPGTRSMATKCSGLFVRAPRRHFQERRDSLAVPWASSPSSLKVWRMRTPSTASIPLFMAPVARWVERKLPESLIGKPASTSVLERLPRR